MSSGISTEPALAHPIPTVSSLREGNAFVFAGPSRWGGSYGPVSPTSTDSWSQPCRFSTVSIMNSLESGGDPGFPQSGRVGAGKQQPGQG